MRRYMPVALLLVTLAALVACSDDGRTMRPAGPNQTLSIITTTVPTTPTTNPLDAADRATPTTASGQPATSTGGDAAAAATGSFTVGAPWAEGGAIDDRYTCNGVDVSPALQWSGVPAGTVELAVVVLDPDAGNFIHWVLAGIAPGVTAIAEGQVPPNAVQGINGFGTTSWRGPCPPAGESHTYRFEVHALSASTGLADASNGEELLRAIDSNTLATALTVGVYPAA